MASSNARKTRQANKRLERITLGEIVTDGRIGRSVAPNGRIAQSNGLTATIQRADVVATAALTREARRSAAQDGRIHVSDERTIEAGHVWATIGQAPARASVRDHVDRYTRNADKDQQREIDRAAAERKRLADEARIAASAEREAVARQLAAWRVAYPNTELPAEARKLAADWSIKLPATVSK